MAGSLRSQFFTYHQTPVEERITITSFYLDGAALAWYQWMYKNRQIASWEQFLTALETRFAPMAYDDPRGNLFKLTQTSTSVVYLTEFEALTNHLDGLSNADLLSCFISGLKIEIRREILAQQPTTLSQAAELVRLQEDKIQDIARASRPRPWQTPPSSKPPFMASSENASSVKPAPGLLPTPPSKPRFCHLSGPEMDEKGEKGLCFNCDQKWSRNHTCGARVFLMVDNDDDDSSLTGDLEQAVAQIDSEDPGGTNSSSQAAQLSLHALSGAPAADTIRILGHIGSHPVRVLIDGGSTHNFIQDSIAVDLGLAHNPIAPFRVLVGSGQELICSKVCSNVSLLIHIGPTRC